MRFSKHSLVFVLLVLTLLISGRYAIVILYQSHQKPNFRASSYADNNLKTQVLLLPVSQLYHSSTILEWKENNTELVIASIYYEVAGIKIENEIAHISLVEDKKESSLFAWLFNELAEEEDKKSSGSEINLDFEFISLNRQINFFKAIAIVNYRGSLLAKEKSGFPGLHYLPPKGATV